MAEKVYPMTAEGKEKLQKELKDLKLVKRPEVIERIKVARSFGDLSENSEYDAAKDEQSAVEQRIIQIEQMLKYAQVIDADSVDPNEVSIGKTVTYTEVGTDDPESYTIVGSDESDPLNGKISNDSPIAQQNWNGAGGEIPGKVQQTIWYVNADTGEVMGTAVRATTTVTFAYNKVGLTKNDGKDYAGNVVVANDMGTYAVD